DFLLHARIPLAQEALPEALARLAGPDPSERPCGVAAHQWVAVIGEGAEQFRHGIRIPQVPQGDRDVPPQAAAPRALDRGAAEPALELLLGDVEQGEEQGPRARAGARGKLRMHLRRGLRIVGADHLTDVAAKDMVADRGPEFTRDRTAVLDRQIRDAPA